MSSFDTAMLFILTVTIGIGFIGNVISFLIFSRKTFRKNSISTYCRALAIFDMLIVYQLVIDLASLDNVYLPYLNDSLCKFYYFATVVVTTVPGWILVTFSLDKTLSMRRNNKIVVLKKKWFQWLVVTLIALINLLIYLEIPIDLKLEPYPFYPNLYYCDWSTLPYFKAIIFLYLFESGLVPFAIMLASSIFTIYMIRKSRRSVERAGKIDTIRRSRDIKYAISSLAFNFLYVTLKIPLIILYILFAYNLSINDYFATVAIFMFFLNSSASFFIHFASNLLFRKEFFIMLRIRKINRIDMSHSNTARTVTNLRQLPKVDVD